MADNSNKEPTGAGSELTREEEIVLKALAEGLKDAEIEEFLLDPNDGSIESYVQSILARLGLSSRAELLLYAHSHGLTAKST